MCVLRQRPYSSHRHIGGGDARLSNCDARTPLRSVFFVTRKFPTLKHRRVGPFVESCWRGRGSNVQCQIRPVILTLTVAECVPLHCNTVARHKVTINKHFFVN